MHKNARYKWMSWRHPHDLGNLHTDDRPDCPTVRPWDPEAATDSAAAWPLAPTIAILI